MGRQWQILFEIFVIEQNADDKQTLRSDLGDNWQHSRRLQLAFAGVLQNGVDFTGGNASRMRLECDVDPILMKVPWAEVITVVVMVPATA